MPYLNIFKLSYYFVKNSYFSLLAALFCQRFIFNFLFILSLVARLSQVFTLGLFVGFLVYSLRLRFSCFCALKEWQSLEQCNIWNSLPLRVSTVTIDKLITCQGTGESLPVNFPSILGEHNLEYLSSKSLVPQGHGDGVHFQVHHVGQCQNFSQDIAFSAR